MITAGRLRREAELQPIGAAAVARTAAFEYSPRGPCAARGAWEQTGCPRHSAWPRPLSAAASGRPRTLQRQDPGRAVIPVVEDDPLAARITNHHGLAVADELDRQSRELAPVGLPGQRKDEGVPNDGREHGRRPGGHASQRQQHEQQDVRTDAPANAARRRHGGTPQNRPEPSVVAIPQV